MLSKICFYCNKIFVADNAYVTAYSYNKNSKSENEKFQECFKIKVPLKNSFVKDIRIDVVDNYVIGYKSLIILIIDGEGLYKAFNFCNIFLKQIYEILLPTWQGSDTNCFGNIYISNGPTFLYSSDSPLSYHFYSVPYNRHKNVENQFLCSDIKQFKVLQFKCFGPFYDNYSQHYLSLLVLSSDILCGQHIKFFGFISEKIDSDVKYENLKLNFFFPQCFENLLKTLQVIKCISSFNKESSNIKLKECASILCTVNECLVFENSVLKYCCKLPFSVMDTMCIKNELSLNLLNLKNFFITLENKTVFLVNILKNFNCQVAKHWTDIEIAISGDILMKGSKQMLLFAQTEDSLWQHDCILYDMVSLLPFNLLCNSTISDKCLKSTALGLERKVQVGMSTVKKIEHEISEKSAATIDALSKINEFNRSDESLKNSNIFQESLLDLILSKDENRVKNVSLDCKTSSVKLLEKKQCINNQWIISMLFLNDGERSICNPSIKLLAEGNEMTSVQKLFICKPDNFHGKCSRMIDPKETFFVIINTEVLMLCEKEEIIIVLTWYTGSEDEFDNEIFLNEEKKVIAMQQIWTKIKVSVNDILNYQMKKGISSFNDILFARSSKQRICLSVISLHSDISRLEDILMDKNKTLDLHLLKSSSGNCLCINDENSILFGTHLLLQNCKQNMAEIYAFVRNEKEMCILIHYLYQKLPEDSIISPCCHFKDEYLKLAKDLVLSMKSELDLLISSFNVHNVSSELRKNYPKLMSSQKVGILSFPKQVYHRIRTVLVKKECISDSVFKTVTST